MLKVQIYLQNAADAARCAGAGADFIGLVSDAHSLVPDSLSYEAARAVFASVPAGKMRVALSLEQSVTAILEMVRAVQPDVLHLAASPLPVDTIAQLRAAEPRIKIMEAVAMNTGDPLAFARRYQPVCDYFLLDTNDPDAIDVGATGKTHDWNVSAQLVRQAHIPVILAGGLSPDNVADAVRLVRPWGVDSYSHTNLPGRPIRKDIDKVSAFVRNARGA